MRPWSCIPIGLLAILPLVAPAQLPLHQLAPTTQSFTLLDALYKDPEYESLIKLLQRAKLIPTFNKLNGSTFFAPTNDAVKHHASFNLLWQEALNDDTHDLQDNLQLRLRQQLFYHLFNYTVRVLPTEQTPQEHRTLLYPRDTSEPPTQEPPPYPPWMPVQNGTLGTEPQRLRLSARDDALWAGVDASGKGGVKVVKDAVETANGLLLGLDRVLEMPPDLATVVSRHPRLSYLHKILTPELTIFLNNTPTLTLFLPIDDAWEALPPLERLWLESEFAADDLTRILNMHTVLLDEREVKWSDSMRKPVNLTTIDGPTLEIVPKDDKIKVSDADIVERDIYASNGVLHTVSSLLIPPGALQLTPEKYLLALDCTEFVSLVHSVNLTHLINDTETEYTILAPRDDVIKLFTSDDLPHRGSEELKRLLQYHFIPGKWAPKKFEDGMLVETVLEEPGLAGGRQVMAVEVTEDSKKSQAKAIRFAGAGVMGETEDVGNALVYFISRPLVPPVDMLETVTSNLEFSSFTTGIYSTNLADTLKSTPQTTLLIPRNHAFRRLGMLVSDHLLSPSSKADFERVIRHHVLASVEYADSLVNGSKRTYKTLEGSDVHVERRTADRSVILTSSGGWADMQSGLLPENMLTQTGVVHEVTDIMIPRSVELTVGKLVKAAKASTMSTMIMKAGLDWVLNGTAPPEGSPWAEKGLPGSGWTLLCPTDDAFKEVNLTELYSDDERLRAIVAQHLILTPPASTPRDVSVLDTLLNNRPLPLDDAATYSTLRSSDSVYGDVIVRVLDGGKDREEGTMVGVKGARGTDGDQDWAHVVSWGRSTTGGGTGGVVQIDRLLSPYAPSWWVEYGAALGVGAFGVILIGAFFYGVRWVWQRDTTEATYEPVGGFGPDDGEE
ncbi:FAS1 domain-containing protein [Polyporus arcularius HHB13444]|uniref:FAS1 domain-containing protein n=1 Tax=Polyporus arcularius HHB13444 TaxID=1314778 RepID=A0A5C3P1Z6_9APHY|nr:FAS1 domain-containing protein [Polyporus arcularius HHB13444]